MKKYGFGIVFILLTLLWMGVIFYFSSQTGADSSQMSGSITNAVIRLFIKEYDTLPFQQQIEIYDVTSYIIRKTAHYMEYAVLAMFVYFSFYFFSKRKYLNYSISLLIAILYAISDEFHQSFVANRMAVFKDVIIDSLGALTMILLIAVIESFIEIRKLGRQND